MAFKVAYGHNFMSLIHLLLSAKLTEKITLKNTYFWESLILQLQAHNIVYYFGIDKFLKAYKKAVYSCLKDVQQD